jgi:hypothetical protein
MVARELPQNAKIAKESKSNDRITLGVNLDFLAVLAFLAISKR